MADKEEISWPYTPHPCLGMRLKTASGEEYPVIDEKLVMIDTGYSGEVLLPRDLYEGLKLNMWEEPEPDEFELGDGSTVFMKVAHGYILIPKLRSDSFSVRIHSMDEEGKDTSEIIIGTKFIKRFKLLLDGPANRVCVL